jgi:heme/copper-type cytochrome/quinol oxidase subunit 1
VNTITKFIFLPIVTLLTSFFKNLIKFSDIQFFFSGIQSDFTNFLFFERFKIYLNRFNDLRKYALKKYVYTINHKRIALNYFYFSMITGLSGAALATMIRLELAYPGSTFFKGDSLRYLQVITAHGLIMVFFVVVPILFGGFANFFIPYHIGSKDVAFPRLNSIGFWIQPCGWLLIAKTAFLRPQFWRYYDKPSFYSPLLDKSKHRKYMDFKENSYFFNKSLKNYEVDTFFTFWKPRKKINYENYSVYSFIPNKLLFWTSIIQYPESFWYVANKAVKARRKKVYFTKCSNRTLTMSGWVFITPFSSNTKFTGIGSQDIAVLSVIFAGVSTTISFTNLLITRRTLSMPGLRNRRVLLPFITIALFLTMRMLALVTPVLGAAMIMLLLDRHWQTTFFEFVYGGDTVLFQHLFWFFGHPEVYILIIPSFGIMNMILPYSNTRRIASKHHMIWAIYMMAYMGFVVWGHHMYLVGLDHRSRALYSTITVMISLPATVKIVNWTLTLLNGALKWDVPFVFALAYMLLFMSGGLTGMWLSHVGLNVSMHDTFYVIAHFHLMLSGATITACFAGIYYYFPALFGIKYSRTFGYLHLIYYFGGQWMTFIPMFWLGYSGMPRRIHDYPAFLMGWHGMASVGHLTTLIGVMFFFFMLLDSHIERRVAVHNTLGIPRWHKRVLYYVFKIRYLQYTNKKLTRLPNSKVRLLLSNPYFNEFEIYKN